MSDRSPITDPQPGDVIQQYGKHGLIIRVTKRDDSRVFWEHKTPKAKHYEKPNSWTYGAWVDVVARGATVLHVAAQDSI